jgi:hypothetical protein
VSQTRDDPWRTDELATAAALAAAAVVVHHDLEPATR